MTSNVANLVCRMAIFVVLITAQMANAAPATRRDADAWDVVTEAAEVSTELPAQSMSRSFDLTSGSSPPAVTPQQAQSAQQLAALHEEQDQPTDTTTPTTTASSAQTQTTYQLCAAAYPALVPKPVAPTSPISYGTAGNTTTTTQCSTLAQQWVVTCNQCQANPASSTNCQRPDLATACANARAQCGGGSGPVTPPANPSTFTSCDANKMNYYNVCNLCLTVPNATMCKAFHSGPGECAAIKAACPNYTPVTPQGYVPNPPASTCTKDAQQWLVVCNACKVNPGLDQCVKNANWPTVCPNVWKMCSAASSSTRRRQTRAGAVDPVLSTATTTPSTGSSAGTSTMYTPSASSAAGTGTTVTQQGASGTLTRPSTSTTSSQPQQPAINAMICQQVLNAPGAAPAPSAAPAVAPTGGSTLGTVPAASASTTAQKSVILGM